MSYFINGVCMKALLCCYFSIFLALIDASSSVNACFKACSAAALDYLLIGASGAIDSNS